MDPVDNEAISESFGGAGHANLSSSFRGMEHPPESLV